MPAQTRLEKQEFVSLCQGERPKLHKALERIKDVNGILGAPGLDATPSLMEDMDTLVKYAKDVADTAKSLRKIIQARGLTKIADDAKAFRAKKDATNAT
jgi:hypothetical protein